MKEKEEGDMTIGKGKKGERNCKRNFVQQREKVV
jgi:hypothetical protein